MNLKHIFFSKTDEQVTPVDQLEHRQLRIGDAIPGLRATSTLGYLNLQQLAEGKWLIIFSHPAPFTSVCSTELATLAAKHEEFQSRGVVLVGICRSSVEEQAAWHSQIKDDFGVDITFPVICDRSGAISNLLGMVHPLEAESCTIRKTMIVDRTLRIRVMQEYPIAIGRSTEEMLRVVDALQATDQLQLLAGADWQPGDAFLLPPDVPDLVARRRYGEALREINSYIKTVSLRAGGVF